MKAGPHLAAYLQASADLIVRSAASIDEDVVARAIATTGSALRSGLPLLVCGNGGSAADAEHITGELVGRLRRERQALNVICLSSGMAAITAWANDVGFDGVFARQVEAYGRRGGVLLGLSTSGNSVNVVMAFEQARRMSMTTIALTGESGGKLASLCDILISVPSRDTPMIQQVHQCLYHFLCERIEAEF